MHERLLIEVGISKIFRTYFLAGRFKFIFFIFFKEMN
jgi:hypothetical protein